MTFTAGITSSLTYLRILQLLVASVRRRRWEPVGHQQVPVFPLFARRVQIPATHVYVDLYLALSINACDDQLVRGLLQWMLETKLLHDVKTTDRHYVLPADADSDAVVTKTMNQHNNILILQLSKVDENCIICYLFSQCFHCSQLRLRLKMSYASCLSSICRLLSYRRTVQ